MHFWSQLQAFLFFHEVFQLDKFEVADFKYDNIIFKFQPKKTKMRHFGPQIQALLFFSQKFCNERSSMELNSTKYIFGLKYPKIAILFASLTISVSSKNFAIRQIRRCRFGIRQQFSKMLPQKYPNKALLVPNLDIFVFSQNFAIRQIRGC